MEHEGDRPIVVVGCARSGTTLLQSMIHSHPRLAMPPENRYMMPVYRSRAEFGDLRESQNLERLADRLTKKGTKIKDLGLSRPKVRKRLYKTPPTIGSMLGSILVAFAEAHDKPRWGDKRPNYIQSLPEVLELFPDAQIVHIIRDGRDSAASLLTMPWWGRGFEPAVHKWREAIEAGNQAKEAFEPSSYFEFRYEDLVADPETSLKSLCAFVGEDFHEAMLEPSLIADITPEYKVWHEGLQKPVNATAVRRWERDLTSDQVALFEHVAGDQLRQQGYDVTRGGAEPSASALETWGKVDSALSAREQQRATEKEALDAEYSHPVAAILTSGQRSAAKKAGWFDDYKTPTGPPPEPESA